jgi:hypothetical protein
MKADTDTIRVRVVRQFANPLTLPSEAATTPGEVIAMPRSYDWVAVGLCKPITDSDSLAPAETEAPETP